MLLSIDQFAERLGVHPSTLRRWLKRGGNLKLPKPLPVKAIGGGPLWRAVEVDAWRAEQIIGALPEPIEPPEDERPRLSVVR